MFGSFLSQEHWESRAQWRVWLNGYPRVSVLVDWVLIITSNSDPEQGPYKDLIKPAPTCPWPWETNDNLYSNLYISSINSKLFRARLLNSAAPTPTPTPHCPQPAPSIPQASSGRRVLQAPFRPPVPISNSSPYQHTHLTFCSTL